MQPLNVSRQLAKSAMEALSRPNQSINDLPKSTWQKYLDLHHASEKFTLLTNGEALPSGRDMGYKALSNVQTLRLPYKFIALEFPMQGEEGLELPTTVRGVIYAREYEGFIALTGALVRKSDGKYFDLGESVLASTDYLPVRPDGVRVIRSKLLRKAHEAHDRMAQLMSTTLLNFLNALACSNVGIETTPTKKSGKVKACLPFDTYHTLVVKVPKHKGESEADYQIRSRRSPREHLRRGHIRELEDKCIWINSMIICAGAKGKVTKDYLIGSKVC